MRSMNLLNIAVRGMTMLYTKVMYKEALMLWGVIACVSSRPRSPRSGLDNKQRRESRSCQENRIGHVPDIRRRGATWR